ITTEHTLEKLARLRKYVIANNCRQHCICAIGANEYRISTFGSLLSFCPSMTFTIEQQNKILSLVTTFGCRRRGRRMDETLNSTNARTLAAMLLGFFFFISAS